MLYYASMDEQMYKPEHTNTCKHAAQKYKNNDFTKTKLKWWLKYTVMGYYIIDLFEFAKR